jgi:tetratricopeptide (TPR) repeat protein
MKFNFLILVLIILISSCSQERNEGDKEPVSQPRSLISSYNNEKTIDLSDYPLLKDANNYLKSKEYDKMLEKLEQAEVKYGSMQHIFNEKGLCLIQLGRLEEALICFDSIIKHDKNDFRAYSNRAQVYYRLFKPDLAISDHNKAIEIDPTNSAIYYNKGLALLYKKDKKQACENFNKALELGFAEDYSTEIYTVLKNECE